jgi:hypothetical protein
MISDNLQYSETLQTLKGQADRERMRIKQELDIAEDNFRVLESAFQFYQKGWSAHFKHLIEKKSDFFKKLRVSNSEAAKIFEEIYIIAKKTVPEELRRFPGTFEKACNDMGLDIDRTSRHPHYKVCQGFLEVEVLESSEEIRISDREGTLQKIPCDIGALIENLQQENKRIFQRKVKPQDFLNRLYKEYKTILK